MPCPECRLTRLSGCQQPNSQSVQCMPRKNSVRRGGAPSSIQPRQPSPRPRDAHTLPQLFIAQMLHKLHRLGLRKALGKVR